MEGLLKLNKSKKIIKLDENTSRIIADNLKNYSLNKKYFIRTYGCQLNENDSEKIAGLLNSFGYDSTDEMEKADLIVFNTCTIRENANDKIFGNLGIVKHLKNKNPEKIIILCGCMMKEDHNRQKVLDKYKFVDILFGPSDIHKLPEILKTFLVEKGRIDDVGDQDFIVEGLPVIHKKKFRALSTIIYGCNNFCSYCIVPYVRGRERSRDINDVLSELKTYGEQGYKEVMLLGQNVNSYGNDNNLYDFADLLRKAGEISSIKRIRFMTSHPRDLSKKLIDVMSVTPSVMPHIHLPLQSGSDRILKLMNRGYNTAQFFNLVKYAREKIPDISITTDIIVGFPGETEEDFIETLGFMGKVCFDGAFTFQYSKRTGTPAADFEDQISQEIITRRFNQLVELQNSCSFASNQKVLDTKQEVLVEGLSDSSDLMLTGRTPHNRLVNFPVPASKKHNEEKLNESDYEGRIALVKVLQVKTFSLEGKFIKWL